MFSLLPTLFRSHKSTTFRSYQVLTCYSAWTWIPRHVPINSCFLFLTMSSQPSKNLCASQLPWATALPVCPIRHRAEVPPGSLPGHPHSGGWHQRRGKPWHGARSGSMTGLFSMSPSELLWKWVMILNWITLKNCAAKSKKCNRNQIHTIPII